MTKPLRQNVSTQRHARIVLGDVNSIQGWLGGHSPEEFVNIARSDWPYPCHTIKNQQCAGMAIFRRNTCKSPLPPAIILEKDKETVFAWPADFVAHHTLGVKK